VPVWVSLSSRSQKAGRESELWLTQESRGRPATGSSPTFWGGEAAGSACPMGACWHGQSPCLAAYPGTAVVARHHPKEGCACLLRALWLPWQKAASVDVAPSPLLGLQVGLNWSRSAWKYAKPGLKMSGWSAEGRSLKSHLLREDKHLGLFPQGMAQPE